MDNKKLALRKRIGRSAGHVEDMDDIEAKKREDFPQGVGCKARGGGVKGKKYDKLIAQLQKNHPNLSSAEAERYVLELRNSNNGKLSGMGFKDIIKRIGIVIERDRGMSGGGSAEDEKCLDKRRDSIQRSLFKLKEMVSWRTAATLIVQI